jgi:hypothetical protein
MAISFIDLISPTTTLVSSPLVIIDDCEILKKQEGEILKKQEGEILKKQENLKELEKEEKKEIKVMKIIEVFIDKSTDVIIFGVPTIQNSYNYITPSELNMCPHFSNRDKGGCYNSQKCSMLHMCIVCCHVDLSEEKSRTCVNCITSKINKKKELCTSFTCNNPVTCENLHSSREMISCLMSPLLLEKRLKVKQEFKKNNLHMSQQELFENSLSILDVLSLENTKLCKKSLCIKNNCKHAKNHTQLVCAICSQSKNHNFSEENTDTSNCVYCLNYSCFNPKLTKYYIERCEKLGILKPKYKIC